MINALAGIHNALDACVVPDGVDVAAGDPDHGRST